MSYDCVEGISAVALFMHHMMTDVARGAPVVRSKFRALDAPSRSMEPPPRRVCEPFVKESPPPTSITMPDSRRPTPFAMRSPEGSLNFPAAIVAYRAVKNASYMYSL